MRRLQETINPVHFECNPKAARFYVIKHVGWCKGPSALTEDGAPSASLDHLKAPAAPTHPGAPPPPRAGSPWPQELASGRPNVDESLRLPLSGTVLGTSKAAAVTSVTKTVLSRNVCLPIAPMLLPPLAMAAARRLLPLTGLVAGGGRCSA